MQCGNAEHPPARAMTAASPTALMAAVLPPVFGPVTVTTLQPALTRTSTGTVPECSKQDTCQGMGGGRGKMMEGIGTTGEGETQTVGENNCIGLFEQQGDVMRSGGGRREGGTLDSGTQPHSFIRPQVEG